MPGSCGCDLGGPGRCLSAVGRGPDRHLPCRNTFRGAGGHCDGRPAPKAAPAAPVLPPTATDEQHFAIGEIKFGGGWVSIESLFKDYQQAGADQKALAAKIDTAQGTVTDLTAS